MADNIRTIRADVEPTDVVLESTTDDLVTLTLRIEAQLAGPQEKIQPLAPHLTGALMAMLYPHGER